MAATTKGAAFFFFLRECLTGRCDNPDYGNKLKERLIYIYIFGGDIGRLPFSADQHYTSYVYMSKALNNEYKAIMNGHGYY